MKIIPADTKKRLLKWLADQLPTVRRTIYNTRQMQTERAPDLDVDQVHQIIEEAQTGNVDGLFRLYRDMIIAGSHLQGRFVERKEAVLGDTLSVQPVDKEDPDDVAAATVVQSLIDGTRDWEKAIAHLLDSALWPVALVEKTFRVSDRVIQLKGGRQIQLQYELAALTIVPYELLTHQNGRLQIRQTDEQGNPIGVYDDPDPGRYIVHRGHLLTSVPDNWGGPMRSIIFWWLLGHMGRDWWARYLDKYGSPFVVGKYDQGDDASRSILERAFSYATKIGGLVVSRETEITLQQANTTGGDAFDKFREACNQEIANLVLGQSLSSGAKSTGLGSGVSRQQEAMRQDKRMADARRLGATLRYELAEQFLRINGLAGQTPKLVWGADTPDESTATGDTLVALKQAGLEPTDDALPTLSEKVGFPLQRAAVPAPAVGGPGVDPGAGGRFGMHSVGRVGVSRIDDANMTIVRHAAAELAPVLRRKYAPVVQLIRTSKSPADALNRVEAYCAKLDPLEATEITEAALRAMAANGAAAQAN